MPPTTTKSTPYSASVTRISSASKSRSGGACILRPGLCLGACQGHLGAEAVEADPVRHPSLRRHGAVTHQVTELVAVRQPRAAEDRPVAHGGQDRAEALPRDVFVATLDARDRALARPRPVGELALAEAVPRPKFLDEFAWIGDTGYGI